MPKNIGSGDSGKVDILSLAGVGFLVFSLFAVVLVAANPEIRQIFAPKASGTDYPTPPPLVEPPPAETTSGYTLDQVINTVADQNRAGYDCTKGGCAPGAGAVSGYYLADNGKYYAIGGTGNDPATYADTSLAAVKAREEAARTATQQTATQQTPAQQTTSTTSTSLEKTDEGFIRTTTTITRDATGKIVDSKSISTTAKTTSTFTQVGADLIRTDTTVTTDLATGKIVDTAKSQTTLKNSVAQPTTSITVNQQGTVSIKQPAGSVCTFSSDCESGGCGIGGERGGITKTCQTSPEPQPQTAQAAVPQYSSNAECMAAEGNNIFKCRGTTSTQETFNTLNTLTFGGFGNYVGAYSPDKVDLAWRSAGYESAKACQDDLGAKYGPRGAQSCNTYEITKEQATSSIALGTTLTVEGAALIAVPATLAAGSGGAALTSGFTALGGISTLSQTSRAAVAQIEDPFSEEANWATLMAGLSWTNLASADYLIKTFSNAASTARAINLARNVNTGVSLVNAGVDTKMVVTDCFNGNADALECGGSVAALVGDFVFGSLDFKQGQLAFSKNPFAQVPTTPRLDNAIPQINDVPPARSNGSTILTNTEPRTNNIIDNQINTLANSNAGGNLFGNPFVAPRLDPSDLTRLPPSSDQAFSIFNNSNPSNIIFEQNAALPSGENIALMIDGRTYHPSTVEEAQVIISTSTGRAATIDSSGVVTFTTSDVAAQIPTITQPVTPNSQVAQNTAITGEGPSILTQIQDWWNTSVLRRPTTVVEIPVADRIPKIVDTAVVPDLPKPNPEVPTKVGTKIPDADPNNTSFKERTEALKAQGLSQEEAANRLLEENNAVIDWVDKNTVPGDVVRDKDGIFLYIKDEGGTWRQLDRDGNIVGTAFGNYDLNGGEIVATGAHIENGKQIVYAPTESTIPTDGAGDLFDNRSTDLAVNTERDIKLDIPEDRKIVLIDEIDYYESLMGPKPDKINLPKEVDDLYPFQKKLIALAQDKKLTEPAIYDAIQELEADGVARFEIDAAENIDACQGGRAGYCRVYKKADGSTETVITIPTAQDLATYKKISTDEALNKIAELVGHEGGHAYDLSLFNEHGIDYQTPDGKWATELLQKKFTVIFNQEIDNVDERALKKMDFVDWIINNTDINVGPPTRNIPEIPIEPTGIAKVWDQTKIIINVIPETGAGTNFIKTIAKLDNFWNKPQVEGNPSTARSVLFAEAQQQIKEEGLWNWITGPSIREAPGFTVEPPTTIPAEPLVKISPFADESASAIIPEGKTLNTGTGESEKVQLSKPQQAINDTIAKGEVPVVYDLGGSKLTLDRRSIAPGIYQAQYDNGRVAVVKIPYDINAERALKGEYNLIYKLRDALTRAGREDLLIHIIEPISPASFGPDGATLDGYIMPLLEGPTLHGFPNGLTPQDIQDFRDMAKIWDDAGVSFGDLYHTNLVRNKISETEHVWMFFDPAPFELTGTTGIARRIELINGKLPSYLKDVSNIIVHQDQGVGYYPVALNNQKALENMYSALGITQPSTPPIEIKPNLLEQVRNRILGAPPITPGSVFDPDVEITKILGAKGTSLSTQQSSLADFKTKLAYQQKGLADLQIELENTIRRNSDVSEKQLVSIIDQARAKYGMSDTQVGNFYDAIQLYGEKHNQIKTIMEEYPDSISLFEAMFGRKPIGEIEVSGSPANIYMRVSNMDDYEYIYENRYISGTTPAEPSYAAGTTGGFMLGPSTLIPDTGGLVIVENTIGVSKNLFYNILFPNKNTVRLHEEQHVINRMLDDLGFFSPGFESTEAFSNLKNAIIARDDNLVRQTLQKFVAIKKTEAEGEYANEIIAYLTEGRSQDFVFHHLTEPKEQGGLYDFYFKQRDQIQEFLEDATWANMDIVHDVLNKEYNNTTVREAIEGFDNFLTKGYSREEALSILQKEPLRDWAKVADRAPNQPVFVSFINKNFINYATPQNLATLRNLSPQIATGLTLSGGIAYYGVNYINENSDIFKNIDIWWQNLPFNEPESTSPSVSQSGPAKTSEEMLQENILEITNNLTASNFEELKLLAASLGGGGSYKYDYGENFCGPLSLEILKKLGLYSGDIDLLYQLEPGTQWDRVLKAFPSDKFSITNTLEENHSVGDMKYWKDNPLKVGDFMFLEVKGGAFGYDHMLVVDMVDDQGRAYSTTNHFTIENGVKTFTVDRVLLYDPTDPGNPDAMFNRWTDRSLLNVNGNTGTGGFLIVRPKPGTITVTKTDSPQAGSQDLFNGDATYTEHPVPGSNDVKYHVVSLDLNNVEFLVDSPSRRTTTSDFLERNGVDIAINGDGWFRYTDQYGVDRFKTVGYSIADGLASSNYGTIPEYGVNRVEEDILYFDMNNHMQIAKNPNEIPDYVDNAISFPNELIRNGVIQPHPEKSELTPRTALGETADHKLIVVVVEGVENQAGITADELSKLMKELGAVTAVMFDSGSSSTLVIDGQKTIANCGEGTECQTANHLGFILK